MDAISLSASTLNLDHSRSSRRADQGKEFRTEVTEATHREHGEVPEMFFVHSVVSEFTDSHE